MILLLAQIEVIPWEKAIEGGVAVLALIVLVLIAMIGIIAAWGIKQLLNILDRLTTLASDAKDDADKAKEVALTATQETKQVNLQMLGELKNQTRVMDESGSGQAKATSDLVNMIAVMKDEFVSSMSLLNIEIRSSVTTVQAAASAANGERSELMDTIVVIKGMIEEIKAGFDAHQNDHVTLEELRDRIEKLSEQVNRIAPEGDAS